MGKYLRAVEARRDGRWDDPDLKAFGELLPSVAEDVARIKLTFLRECGFTVGARWGRIKPDFPGKFMVVECLGEPETWAIVGDDINQLVSEAFDYAADVYGGNP